MKKTMETLKKVNTMLVAYAYGWHSACYKFDNRMSERAKTPIGKNFWKLLASIDECCMARCRAAC